MRSFFRRRRGTICFNSMTISRRDPDPPARGVSQSAFSPIASASVPFRNAARAETIFAPACASWVLPEG
jgi:hypothetical protein